MPNIEGTLPAILVSFRSKQCTQFESSCREMYNINYTQSYHFVNGGKLVCVAVSYPNSRLCTTVSISVPLTITSSYLQPHLRISYGTRQTWTRPKNKHWNIAVILL